MMLLGGDRIFRGLGKVGLSKEMVGPTSLSLLLAADEVLCSDKYVTVYHTVGQDIVCHHLPYSRTGHSMPLSAIQQDRTQYATICHTACHVMS